MTQIKHDVSTWFGLQEGALYTYFQDKFKGNTINGFKAPRKMVRQFNNFLTESDIHKAINALGEIYIQGIVHLKYKQMSKTQFELYEQDTKDYLLQAVCEAIQFAMQNEQVYERINASSLTTNNFTLNKDTTNWMLTMDMYGKMAWNLIQNSGIDDYMWVTEDALLMEDHNGNIKVLAKADLALVPEMRY